VPLAAGLVRSCGSIICAATAFPQGDIAVVGTERKCYETYKRYCKNSQIPDHERLRSNSLSRPDNIWGFPGYALREVFKGQASGIKGVFKVFGEPALAESYTPRAGDVFDSLDREAKRIHWEAMFRQGQVRRLRKTAMGAIASPTSRVMKRRAPSGRRWR
jgi:hypothetical protein